MKKKIFIGLVGLSLVLAGCGMKENPQEVIRQTQANIIDQAKKVVFAKKQGQFDAHLNVNVATPIANGKVNLTATGLMDNYTGQINLVGNGNFSYQGLSGSADFGLSLITTLQKIYFKLNHLSANLPDPTLNAYLAMAKMVENKWFFAPNRYQTANLKSVDFQNELKKYPLFKAEKVLGKYRYKVELDKQNLAKIILDINKQLYSGVDLTVDEIEKQLTGINIEGVLKIESDKLHFSFSGYAENFDQKLPINLTYLSNKFRLDLPTLDINLDKSGDSFKGYMLLKTVNVKLDLTGKLNENEFSIDLSYNQAPINVKLYLDYMVKPVDNLKIFIPQNAISIEQLLGGFGQLNNIGSFPGNESGTGSVNNLQK